MYGGELLPVAAEEALVVPALDPVGLRTHVGRRHRFEVRRGELGPRVETTSFFAALVVEVGPDHDGLRDEGLALAAEAVVHDVAIQQDGVHEKVTEMVHFALMRASNCL